MNCDGLKNDFELIGVFEKAMFKNNIDKNVQF
jgi:hypothetical protein